MKKPKIQDPKGSLFRTASAKLQFFLLVFTVTVLFLFFLRPLNNFYSVDKYPEIVSLTPQKMESFGGSPSCVKVGIYVSDFPEFDVDKEKLVIHMTVWFRFDPRLISLERIGKFKFDKARILYRSDPSTRIVGDELIARYDVWADFTISLNYKNFPFNDHRISFSLTHYLFSPSELIFESSRSDFVLSPDINVSGWRLADKSIRTGYVETRLDSYDPSSSVYYPRIIFSMDYARVGGRHIISIIFPLLLIFFIALFTLCMGGSIGISVATVTGTIAHRFIIETMSPSTGYFMLSDYLFLLFLVACSMIFVVDVFEKRFSAFHKNLFTIFIHLLVLSVFLYLLFPLL